MAAKKYIQLNANGVWAEDNENLVTSSELSAITGAAAVGVDSSTVSNSSASNLQDVLEDLSAAIDGAGNVSSVNGLTGAVTISGQNADTNHTPVNYTSAGASITENLAGIDTAIGDIQSSIASPFNYQGAFDASAGNFGAISPASVGDWYKVTVAGTIDSITYDIGDNIVINKDVAGTVVTADVDKVDNTDQVSSVNGAQGVVVLTSDNIDSDATITVATPAGAAITDDLEALDGAIANSLKDTEIVGYQSAGAIAIGSPVYASSTTQVSAAEADQDTTLEVIGVAKNATAGAGEDITIIKFGPSGSLYSGLTAGNPVYLSESGGITETQVTTSGSYSLRIGKATSATEIDIETNNSPVLRA